MTRRHLLLPALPLMALLAFLLLAPSPSGAQDATVTFDPPTGAPGASVAVASARQGAVCPLFAVDQPVVWDDQQVIGQVEGNSCIGWRGSFTVPRDAESGGHAVSTRSAAGDLESLGTFPVTPTALPFPTVVSATGASTPAISALLPPTGPANTTVTISGSGFAPDDNAITFGPATSLHHPDGSPGNVVAHAGSPDGTTLQFTVPTSGPSGILCSDDGRCLAIAAKVLQPGSYDVTVVNGSGTSNAAAFGLTAP